jgi:putative SOS response-associated peptidase YedK
MCGSFTNNAKSKQIASEFNVSNKNPNLFQPRYNIVPSQMVDVVFEPVTERIISQIKKK